MTGHHDADRPSSSSRRTSSSDENKINDETPINSISSSTPDHLSSSNMVTGMPSLERNQYSNKESCKVNGDLDFSGTCEDGDDNVWASDVPVIDIDFSQFIVPIVAPESAPTAEQLVCRLMRPPRHAFAHGILSMQWIIGALGMQHFDFRSSDERYVLTKTSVVRTQGAAMGIPAVYLEWLCGDDENTTAADQGVYLTHDFFEELAQDA